MNRFSRVSLEDLPESQRQDFWRDVVCTDLYDIAATDWSEAGPLRGSWEVRDCTPFGFAEVRSPNRTRTRERRAIARDGMDAITVQRVLGEPVEFSFDSDAFMLQPGDLCILAMDWRHTVRAASGVGLRSVEIPRAALSPFLTGGQIRRPVVLRSDSPLAAVLSSGLDAAWEQVPKLDPTLGNAVLRNLCGLVALAYGATDDGLDGARAGARTAKRQAAIAFVKQHLADADLTPARVAAALGMSARSLHKLFSDGDETFAHLVLRERAACCRAMLDDPASAHRSVADIAYGCGFNSLATFYRAFQTLYSASPSEIRTAAAPGLTKPASDRTAASPQRG